MESSPPTLSRRTSIFFQAEDGIRDIGVTGVQTCALPISPHLRTQPARARTLSAGRRERRLMAKPQRVVTDSMIGLKLPDFARHSDRVATVLGHNPGPFTGPGTNTYVVGIGRRPMLLDTGAGVPIYEELLPHALNE